MDCTQYLGNIVQAAALGTSLVLENECLQRLDALLGSIKEGSLLVCESGILLASYNLGLALAQTIGEDTLVVGREVRYGTTLVQGVLRADILPLRIGEDRRNASDGASSYNALTLDNDRLLGLEQCLQHLCAALHGGYASAHKRLVQRRQAQLLGGATELMVLLGSDKRA